ncbi:MAG TPA: T9SS type A sorting domain-containing protein, partial [Chitinophagales bacterium]|nr:T9SS type A sorting domain-containing protein [Chitinophagales bacterium]
MNKTYTRGFYRITYSSDDGICLSTNGGASWDLINAYRDATQTASEKNTLKFEIQKSLESSNWLSIGENTAAGNSTTLRNYDFNDNNPVFGNNYYRLKIIDLDGTFTYSNVINIPINTVTNNSFVQVYPNPTKGILNIDVQSTSAYDINMITFDVLGKKVLEKSMNVVKGLNTLSIDYSTIAKGTYILQYSDGEGKLH